MKTAEEWVKDSVFQHDKTQSDILFKAIIKQIQLDAWKQGMVDAIYQTRLATSKDTDTPVSDSIAFINNAIRTKTISQL